jgi:putative endonuclease
MKREYHFYVYILSNYKRTTFYIGFTNHIIRRIIEHKFGLGSNFTKKYKLKYLVYFEECQYVDMAITREKKLKGWNRKKKIDLIKETNPSMGDLSKELFKNYGITDEEAKEYLKINKR